MAQPMQGTAPARGSRGCYSRALRFRNDRTTGTGRQKSEMFEKNGLVARNYEFVRMGDVEILTQQFAHKIGIGMTRVKQMHPVTQLIALCRETRYFRLALIQQSRIVAPRQNAAGTGNAKTADQQERKQRQRLRKTFPPQHLAGHDLA